MKRTICPYLGLQDDPTTALQYPSEGNFCHHARPIAQIKGSFQQQYCLTGEHTLCPLYRASEPMPMPAAIASPATPRYAERRLLAILGIPVLVASAAFLTLLWNTFGVRMLSPRVIPDTGKGETINFGSNLGGLQAVPTLTPLVPGGQGANLLPTNENCPLPGGWMSYIVNPTDSLFRLSVVYGVSIEELQRVNCMGSQTVILPGQVIYVPFVPTNTPDAANPPLQFNQNATPVPPVINRPQPQASNTSAPPRGVQPTSTSIAPTFSAATPTSILPSATSQPSATPIIIFPSPTPQATQTPFPTRTRRPTRTPWWPFPTRTPVPPTAIPPTSIPPTAIPPTAIPPTSIPPTSIPPTSIPPTSIPPTSIPPTSIPPTSIPPTSVPPTSPPATSIPLTSPPPPTSLPVVPTIAPPPTAPPVDPTAVPPPPTSPPAEPTIAPPPPTSPPAEPTVVVTAAVNLGTLSLNLLLK